MSTPLCADKQEMKKFLENLLEKDIELQKLHVNSFAIHEIEERAFYKGSLDAFESILRIIKAI